MCYFLALVKLGIGMHKTQLILCLQMLHGKLN